MAIYVMSDIHGYYDGFMNLIEKIRFTKGDILYIIGDVIDKGPDSIRMLEWCIEHEESDPKCVLLLGDHESMMFKAIKKNNMVFNIVGIDSKNRFKRVCSGYCNSCAGCEDVGFDLWSRQGGAKTAESFLMLNFERQKRIYDFLYRVYYNQAWAWINSQSGKYLLSHSGYEPSLLYRVISRDNSQLETNETQRLLEYGQSFDSHLLSRRSFLNWGIPIQNCRIIFGHTPIFNIPYHVIDKLSDSQRIAINNSEVLEFKKMNALLIDCGSVGVMANIRARIAAVNLDSLCVDYVNLN